MADAAEEDGRFAAGHDLLRVSMERDSGNVVIHVAGELDFATVGRLRGAAAVALAVMKRPRLILELGDVSFLDSSGLGALVGIWKRTRAHGGRMMLAQVPPRCRFILRRTGVDQFLEMADDVAAAGAALTG